jgi:hypothetical protein
MREKTSLVDAFWQKMDGLVARHNGESKLVGVQRSHGSEACTAASGEEPPPPQVGSVLSPKKPVPPAASITGGTSSQLLEKHPAKAGFPEPIGVLTGPQAVLPNALPPGGLDWLAVSIEGGWTDRAFASIYQDFLDAAELARLNENDHEVIETAGRVWRVHARGRRHQNGWAEIVAECDGVEWHFSKHKMRIGQPLVWITATSMTLMKTGAVGIRAILKDTLQALHIDVSRAYPSRVDVCIDLAGVDTRVFAQHIEEDCYVTRAQDSQIFRSHRRITGIQVGRGIVCRIYDKLLETVDNPEKRSLMIEKRWGGRIPKYATRVEFQLRRDELRERYSCDTLDDLWNKLPHIVQKLTHEWLRMTEEHVDRVNKHQGRCNVSKLWETVQIVFAEVFGKIMERAEAARKIRPETKRLIQQSFGCLLSSLAVDGKLPMNERELIENLVGKFVEHLPGNWWKKLRDRINDFNMREPQGYEMGIEGVPF